MRIRSVALVAGLLALWASVKFWALEVNVLKPNEYSDTYYYFLQAQAAASGGGLAAMTPEYPTPAAALLMLPYWLGGVGYDSYRAGFLVLVVAVDALFVALLAWRTGAVGVLAWVLLETLSGRLALLRFDVIPAELAAGTLLLLLGRRDALAASVAALGAGLKLWPALLLPLAFGRRATQRRTLASGLVTTAILVIGSLLAGGWPRLLSPLGYQRDRGLQIEAVAATPAMLARLGDPDLQIVWSKWNAYEITGPGVPGWLTASSVASVVAFVGFVALVAVWWRSGARPETAAYVGLFAIAAFMATSKALSPQYLLWLAAPASALQGTAFGPAQPSGRTLAAALDPARRARVVITFAWVTALMALTAYVYPLHYDEILAGAPVPVRVLAIRNLLLAGFVLWCALACLWEARAAQNRAPNTSRSD